MAKRLKVLISAYACEFNKGSEPGAGWNMVNQISRFHDVWVITRKNNRYSLEKNDSGMIPGIRCVYYDLPKWMSFWKKGNRGVYLYYYLWQIGAYFVARRLHKRVNFNIVQHVTFGVYWMPSFMSFLNIPFVYGPLGGAEFTPEEFYKTLSFRAKFYERLRNAVRMIAEKDPFVINSIKKAKVVLAKFNETDKRLRVLGAKDVKIYTEGGITKEELNKISEISNGKSNGKSKRFKVVSIGRLLHWKGFHIGLKAFAHFQKKFPDSEYYFIGEGPELDNLRSMSEELSITNNVKFFNQLPRDKVFKILAECDVLLHPSLHDSGGMVCLEAMASGKPVICLDLGGPSMQVTDETGFKVPAVSPEQAVRDITDSMIKLAQDSNLINQMGDAGRERIDMYFDWDKKGEWLSNLYQELVIQ